MMSDKKFLFVYLLILLGSAPINLAAGDDYVSNEVLVWYKESASSAARKSLSDSIGAMSAGEIPQIGVEKVVLPAGTTVGEMIAYYRDQPDLVYYVEPNYRLSALITVPNDPKFQDGTQWSLNNSSDYDIDAPEAWDLETGSTASVTIAVIDTGVDLDHPDLLSKIVAGYDFVNNDSDPNDDQGHGTHVAGIAAASTNNSVGIAGVSWQANIMPVKVLDSEGSGTYYDVANGIIYAADNGADVINLSLGGAFNSRALSDAMKYAYNNGVVICAAAGNDGVEGVIFPAAYDQYCLGVAATDNTDTRASFSSFGPEVDLAAPGDDIYSTYWTSVDGPTYFTASGTSMATPHVSGAAALVVAYNALSPLTRDQVLNQVKYSADDVNSGTYPGEDDYLGTGRLNAYNALATTPTPAIEFVKAEADDDDVNNSSGDDDGSIDPGETIELIVTLINNWGDAVNLSATLSTLAQGVTITDNSATYLDVEGDSTPTTIETGHRADNNANPYVFQVASSVAIGTELTFTLSITADGGYAVTRNFTVYVNDIQPTILLVDDDDGDIADIFFRDALETNGFSYDLWDWFSDGSPELSDLTSHRIVIWITGVDFGSSSESDAATLNAEDRENLMRYLEQGGRLFLSSVDVIKDVNSVDRLEDFGAYYLKVNVATDGTILIAEGAGGDPISDGMQLVLTMPSIFSQSDRIEPVMDQYTTAIFRAKDGNQQACALRHSSYYALVFIPFGFESIDDSADPNNQKTLMDRIIRWLNSVGLSDDGQAPLAPTDLVATVNEAEGNVGLTWNGSYQADVSKYYLYISTDEDFSIYDRREVTSVAYNHDIEFSQESYTFFYKVSAVDEKGNESASSDTVFAEVKLEDTTDAINAAGTGGCFIATAAYGTPLAIEVKSLSLFRDRYLLTNRPGADFIRFYYRYSPQLARKIEKNIVLKGIVRSFLMPFVWLISEVQDEKE